MLTVDSLTSASNDDEFYDLLITEIELVFTDEVYQDDEVYFTALLSLPRGLRALELLYRFDISMQMDDLAWHFVNYPDAQVAAETFSALQLFNLPTFAEPFQQALQVMEPHLAELTSLRSMKQVHAWLRERGAQQMIDPLNERIWAEQHKPDAIALIPAALSCLRKHPEFCVAQ